VGETGVDHSFGGLAGVATAESMDNSDPSVFLCFSEKQFPPALKKSLHTPGI
jgi:hypothetical protein